MTAKYSKPEFSSRIGKEFSFKLVIEYDEYLSSDFIHEAFAKTIVLEVPKSLRSIFSEYLIVSKYFFDAEFRTDGNIILSYFTLYVEDELKQLYDNASIQHKEVIKTLTRIRADYLQEYPEAMTAS